MKCTLCRNGETEEGNVTVTLERRGTAVIIKALCGQSVREDIPGHVLRKIREAIENG